MNRKILCGDIGGTKTILALVSGCNGQYTVEQKQQFDSQSYRSLDAIIEDYVPAEKVDHACFGLAGPVIQKKDRQTSQITNLPWQIDNHAIKQKFSFSECLLLNDFQAIGYGLDALSQDHIIALKNGARTQKGNRVLIGAGTGFGVCYGNWCNDHYDYHAAEVGHTGLPINRPIETDLWKFLHGRFQRVTIERALSGPGLQNLFDFFSQTIPPGTEILDAFKSEHDRSAIISKFALENKDKTAAQALDQFILFYGHIAGDCALHYLAEDGVYLAGGIAPKILTALKSGIFTDGFLNKGKMRSLLESIPVYVIDNADTPLLGCATYMHQSL